MHIKICLKIRLKSVLLKDTVRLQDYVIQPLRSLYAYSTCKIIVILNTCVLYVHVIHNVSCVFSAVDVRRCPSKVGIRIYVISVMSSHKFWSVEIVYSQYWRKVWFVNRMQAWFLQDAYADILASRTDRFKLKLRHWRKKLLWYATQ